MVTHHKQITIEGYFCHFDGIVHFIETLGGGGLCKGNLSFRYVRVLLNEKYSENSVCD